MYIIGGEAEITSSEYISLLMKNGFFWQDVSRETLFIGENGVLGFFRLYVACIGRLNGNDWRR